MLFYFLWNIGPIKTAWTKGWLAGDVTPEYWLDDEEMRLLVPKDSVA